MTVRNNLIDSRRLQIFYYVAKLGSFSKAEAVLSATQPAISRHISRLEEEMGVQLLQRHGRGVTLTDAGEILFRQAEVILEDMADALDELDRAQRNPRGRVSVSAAAIVMSQFMPDILDRIMKRHPDIEISAIQAASGDVYNQLISGRVDVAILMHIPNKTKFNIRKLVDESMVMIAHKDHPVASRTEIKRDSLSELQIILPTSPKGLRGVIDKYVKDGGHESLSPKLQIDSVPLIKATVAKGEYCVIMPQSAFDSDFSGGDFVSRPLKPALTRALYVATRKNVEDNPYIEELVKYIFLVFGEKCADYPVRAVVA